MAWQMWFECRDPERWAKTLGKVESSRGGTLLTSHLCQSRQLWQWEWGFLWRGRGGMCWAAALGLGGTAVRGTKPSPLGSGGGVGAHSPLVPGSPPSLTLGLWTDESGLGLGPGQRVAQWVLCADGGVGSNLSPVSIVGESRLRRAWFCWRQGQFGVWSVCLCSLFRLTGVNMDLG